MSDEKKPKERKVVDLAAIEREYITTTITLEELSKKYGLSMNRIAKACTEGEWRAKREIFRIDTMKKTIMETQQRLVQSQSAINTRHFMVWHKLLNICDEMLDNPDIHLKTKFGQYNIDKLWKLSDIIQKCQNGQRLAEGIIEASKLKELELNERKIELAEKKLPPTEDPTMKGDGGFYEALKTEVDDAWSDEDGNED